MELLDIKPGPEVGKIKRAVEEPLRQIISNAGGEGAVIVQKVKEGKKKIGSNFSVLKLFIAFG